MIDPTIKELIDNEIKTATLIDEITRELHRAREKFPGENVTFAALIEEIGELATALFEEDRRAVRKEAVQVAVMAMRVVLDGDHSFEPWRAKHGLDPLKDGEAPNFLVSDDRIQFRGDDGALYTVTLDELRRDFPTADTHEDDPTTLSATSIWMSDGSIHISGASIETKPVSAARRVTPEMVDAEIADEVYTVAQFLDGKRVTYCTLKLKNGFTVSGESTCADPEGFDEDLGRDLAKGKARAKVMDFLAFRLRDEMTADSATAA